MSNKGKNGQQIAQGNLTKVTNWIVERSQLRDWDEYESKGRINRTIVSQELDFARSVTTQNPDVRKLLENQDKTWFNSESITKGAQEASIERSQMRLKTASAENNKLVARLAELEAENRQLQKELASFKRMQSMLEAGMPGFKL